MTGISLIINYSAASSDGMTRDFLGETLYQKLDYIEYSNNKKYFFIDGSSPIIDTYKGKKIFLEK